MSAPLDLENSPQPDGPSSRLSAIHFNVRSLLGAARSSIYSESHPSTTQNTPRPSRFSFLRRSRGSPELPQWTVPSVTSSPPGSTLAPPQPIFPQYTAGSYQREIAPPDRGVQDDPSQRESRQAATRASSAYGAVDPETAELAEMVQEDRSRSRRSKRSKRRRKHKHHRGAWVRRRNNKVTFMQSIRSPAARNKNLACMISAMFLALVLTIYLCIALLRPAIGQEIHVLFILVIICTTIFFCHSVIRLCMHAACPARAARRPAVPNMLGPDGFRPVRPIRVHLARDENLSDAADDDDPDSDLEREDLDDLPKEKKVAPPPPAYGLWRSSVRVDPNLLHWQRVQHPPPTPRQPPSPTTSPSPAPSEHTPAPAASATHVPRPPSYCSEDGVSYVVGAAPRSVAPPTPRAGGMDDVHPAYRY